jgi:hypothetical protein
VGSPVTSWRRWLANQVVAGHGLAMFVLFAAPLQFFLQLANDHSGAALLAGGLMAAGFAGTLLLAPPLMAVSPRPARPGSAMRALLRLFRVFVGNGDAIQAVARRIDPGWQNSYAGRTPQETARWLASMELIHWAALVASAAPVAAAFWYGHRVLGIVYVVANLVYNVAPNLVIRDTRRRLLRIVQRTPVPAPYTDRSGDVVFAVQTQLGQAQLADGLAEPPAADVTMDVKRRLRDDGR